MATPFIAEIKFVSFNFAPKGWALCSGQILPINQNQALFSLLGTTYGGNGQTTFALPDLRGRVPIHVGASHTIGERGGEENHALTLSELPVHTHQLQGSSNAADFVAPDNLHMSGNGTVPLYGGPGPHITNLRPDTVSNTGGSLAHSNMQPFTVITAIIALQGVFPSRN